MGIGEFFLCSLLIFIDSIREMITSSSAALYAIIGMFIVSEVLVFSSFIWAYFHYRWSNMLILTEFNLEPFIRVTEFLNIASSFVTVTAHRLNEDSSYETDYYIDHLLFISVFFVTFQSDEYILLPHFINVNWMTLYFYILTGLHTLHVCFGFFMLLILSFNYDGQGAVREDDFISGFYWHFVEMVWIILTMLLFL